MKRFLCGLFALSVSLALYLPGELAADEGQTIIVPGDASVGINLRGLQERADAGDAESAYRIGRIEERGIGRPTSPERAALAYRQTAEL